MTRELVLASLWSEHAERALAAEAAWTHVRVAEETAPDAERAALAAANPNLGDRISPESRHDVHALAYAEAVDGAASAVIVALRLPVTDWTALHCDLLRSVARRLVEHASGWEHAELREGS